MLFCLSSRRVAVPSKAPRWQECSNEVSGPLLQEMGARMARGCRVVRGRDWDCGTVDGTPPGPGTITKATMHYTRRFTFMDVKWDCGRSSDQLNMGNGNLYTLKLLTCMDEVIKQGS